MFKPNAVTAIHRLEADLERAMSKLKHSYVDGHEWCLTRGHESVKIFGAINDIDWSLTISAYPAGPKLNQRIPYTLTVGREEDPDFYIFQGTARKVSHVTRSVIRKLTRLEYR